MRWEELLDVQKDLNQKMGVFPPSEDAVSLALMAEVGELLQEIKWGMGDKPGWAWWRWSKGTPTQSSRDAVLEELADIVHFTLLWHLAYERYSPSEPEDLYDAAEAYEAGWHKSPPSLAVTLGGLVISPYVPGVQSMHIGFLAQLLGFMRVDVESAYLRKVVKNLNRSN